MTSTNMNKAFVSALALANLVTALPVLITSLLLIDISQSFGIEVGVAGQVRSVASTASVVMELAMGGLSVRFNLKYLYILGFVLLSLSAVGSYFAPAFMILLIAYALFGISRMMIRPIGYALTGRFIPLQQRPKVTSYQMVGMASAYLVGATLVNVIGDWRLMFIVLLFPLTLINLVLAVKGVPSTRSDTSSRQAYQQAFKDVLFNKSALACLIAYILLNVGGNTVVATFSVSFYRQTFLVDTAFISLAFMVFSLLSILGSLIGGRLITRFGRKPLTVWSILIVSVLTISFMNIPHLWISLMLWILDGLFVAIAMTAYYSLALEQAPAYRATMMSLNEVSMFGGTAIGSALGGVLLLAFNYQILGLMGIFIFVGSLVVHFFTIDPTTQAKQGGTVNP